MPRAKWGAFLNDLGCTYVGDTPDGEAWFDRCQRQFVVPYEMRGEQRTVTDARLEYIVEGVCCARWDLYQTATAKGVAELLVRAPQVRAALVDLVSGNAPPAT